MKSLRTLTQLFGSLLLILCTHLGAQAQDLVTFKNTSWYIQTVRDTKDVAGQAVTSNQEFGQSENVIKFKSDGTYHIKTTFFGSDTSMVGYWTETQHVVALGTADGDAYFWVFQVNSKSQDEVNLTFIPFKDIGQKLELIAKPYKETAQGTGLDNPQLTGNESFTGQSDFNGSWLWSLEETGIKLALEINQVGPTINGEHQYTKNGQTQKYVLSGTSSGNSAEVFMYANESKTQALARCSFKQIDNATILWQVKEQFSESFHTIKDISLEREGGAVAVGSQTDQNNQTNNNTSTNKILEEGEASYYNDKYHGRPTASGERYDKTKLTTAHKTLPFGTMLRVTNKSNGKIVIVKVNDKMSHPTRVVDLSRAAAEKIDLIKDTKRQVTIEIIGEGN